MVSDDGRSANSPPDLVILIGGRSAVRRPRVAVQADVERVRPTCRQASRCELDRLRVAVAHHSVPAGCGSREHAVAQRDEAVVGAVQDLDRPHGRRGLVQHGAIVTFYPRRHELPRSHQLGAEPTHRAGGRRVCAGGRATREDDEQCDGESREPSFLPPVTRRSTPRRTSARRLPPRRGAIRRRPPVARAMRTPPVPRSP
jgi:hypothetical protein